MVKHLKKIRRRNYVILGLFAIIYLCTTMCAPAAHTGKTPAIPDTDGKLFAGSELRRSDPRSSSSATFVQGSVACKSCHKSIYESHIGTAHYRTSRPASKEFIKGSFEAGKNHFIYNKWMEVVMENKNGGYYQTAFMNGAESQSERFDIVIGSGRKGQTYLYWNNGKLYQLPVSYYTPLNDWCNSPGYSTNYIRFSRQIPAHCIECHGTHAKAEVRPDEGTVFTKSQLIYGVDCEKCHGPGTEHIVFHTAHPGEKTGKFIINARLLARQQRLDACALCHSGVRDELKPAFSFKVGDRLDDFSKPAYNTDSMSTLDVHGNQYGLLTASKCFRMSQMDCSSCHNVHVNEANSPNLFSQRCMTCHTEAAHNTCTMAATSGLVLGDNCIDCHMPALPSQKISLEFSNASKSTPDLVRTHRIAIYPESVKVYLEKPRAKKGAGM